MRNLPRFPGPRLHNPQTLIENPNFCNGMKTLGIVLKRHESWRFTSWYLSLEYRSHTKFHQTPFLQDVCIFCATRIQLTAARSQVFSQRRLFRSAYAPNKPPEAATGHQEFDPEEDISRSSYTSPEVTPSSQTQSTWGGPQTRWKGTPRFTAPIQPEPEKPKAEEPVPSQVQHARPRPQPSQRVDQSRQSSSHFQSAARRTTLDRHIGEARRKQLSDTQLWKCGCGLHNNQSDLVCRGCRAPKGGNLKKSDDPSIAQDWKHVKRIGDSSEQKPKPVNQITSPAEPAVDRTLEEARQKRLADSIRKRFVELKPHLRIPPLDFQDLPERPVPKRAIPNQPVPEFEPSKSPSADGPRIRIRQPESRREFEIRRKAEQSNELGKGTQPTPPKASLPLSGSAKPLDDAPGVARGKPEPTVPMPSEINSKWKKWDSSQARPIPEPSQSGLLKTSIPQKPIENNGEKFEVDGEKFVQEDRGVQKSMPNRSEDGRVSDENHSMQPRSTGSDLARAALSKHEKPQQKGSSQDIFMSHGYELMQSRAKPDRPIRTTASQYDQPEHNAIGLSPSNGPNKKAWVAWRPSQPVRNDAANQPVQPRFIQSGSIESLPSETDRFGRENVGPASENSPRKVWKTWRPARDTKADLASIFSDGELNNPGSASILEHELASTEEHTQESPAYDSQLYVSSEEMKISDFQAAESRMARRRQQLEEESRVGWKKPAQAHHYDPTRERRTSIQKARKIIESEAELSDYEDDGEHMRQQRKKQRKQQLAAEKLQGPPTPIYLPGFISVANLAGALRIRIEDFTRKMKDLGFDEINNDHVLDAETAGLIATEFNFEPIVDQEDDQDLMPRPPAEDKTSLPSRPPVVTIMGHVDHGKTTLLDWLRKSSVAASEYGGITQHIGAFSVLMPSGRSITFLDTPGHAAFLEMRQRGANVTDIVILVVAADDSVKPQTVEAIKHAQMANVPMIVAVNKIDKEDANVDKVKQDLARYGVEIEDYGGDTQVVCVSGKTGQGMETLEESAVALADILDMRAETDGPAEGWILEATTKKAGRVATVLVRRGTLYPGDIVVAGTTWTRIRSLRNEAGIQVDSASPGMPVEIDGWKDQPVAGDEALQADDEQHARSVVDIRLQAVERVQMATDVSAVNEARKQEQERRRLAEVADAAAEEGAVIPPKDNQDETPAFKDVPLIVKADVSGSAEAILTSVLALGNTFVRASILRSGVGTVSEFDVAHAASARAHIVAFNIAIEPHIRRAAETNGVKILEQNVIYRLVDLVKGVLEDCLEPIRTKRVLGEAEVAQVFEINVKGRQFVPVAGCKVRNGVMGRKTRVLVKRGEEVVFDGKSDCVTSLHSCFLLCLTTA